MIWLDVYVSQFGSAPGGQGIQIHDFSPGVSETGLFWTVPVAPEAVVIDDALDSIATGPATPVRSDAHGFAGEFRKARATVAWSGRTEQSRYTSDPPEGSKTVFALVGRERNGVFLR